MEAPISSHTDEEKRTLMFQRIECALDMMTRALVLSGLSEYEAGKVNLNTRTAITGIVKERGGGGDGRS